MDSWRARARGRRTAVFALALLVHAALLVLMSSARLKRDRVIDDRTVQALIVSSPSWRTSHAADATPTPVRAPHARSVPRAFADPRALLPPVFEPLPDPKPESAPEPPARTASAPLNLTLSRDQIRAMIARDRPTLAQMAPHAAKTTPYDQLAGDGDGLTLIELPHGVTEVPPRVTIVVAFIEPEPGAAMKDDSVEIRTSIQGQGCGTHAAARERRGGRCCRRDWHRGGHA